MCVWQTLLSEGRSYEKNKARFLKSLCAFPHETGLFLLAQESSPKVRVIRISALSWLYSMLILNRWAFTSLGEGSFGRVWMYFVSWGDFGFTRRSLIGTILEESGLNGVLKNEYVFSYLFTGLLLTFAYVLMTNFVLRSIKLSGNVLLVAIVFDSPAFFTHLAYSTGSLDLAVIIIFILGTLYARHPFTLAVVTLVGVLTHEIFVFLVPALLMTHLLASDDQRMKKLRSISILVSAAVSTFLIVTFGRTNVSRESFESVMAMRIPNSVGRFPLWSGYFEVTSGTGANRRMANELLSDFSRNWLWTLLPIAYLLFLLWILVRFSNTPIRTKALTIISAVTPLVTLLIAYDFYRWLCISAIAALILILVCVKQSLIQIPRRAFATLLVFSVLAPFGGAGLSRPFPFHQEISERVFISNQVGDSGQYQVGTK